MGNTSGITEVSFPVSEVLIGLVVIALVFWGVRKLRRRGD
jgi:hypothetical protein